MSGVLVGLEPSLVLPGARLALIGSDMPAPADGSVTMAGLPVSVVFASPTRLVVEVPRALSGGDTEIRASWCPGTTLIARVARRLATGLHQVDSPAADVSGRLYATFSGARGQEAPVSVFRITSDGAREPFVSGIPNPTSLAFDAEGYLYVSSRFDGTVYRVDDDGAFDVAASDLGGATGLAFGHDGALYVGDRTGTIFRVVDGHASPFAALPPSVAAFHLCAGTDDALLYATAPTLATHDVVYRIDGSGRVEPLGLRFGRPQGLAVDGQGTLHVVEALAWASGIHRCRDGAAPLMAAVPGAIGVTFAGGRLVAATADALYDWS